MKGTGKSIIYSFGKKYITHLMRSIKLVDEEHPPKVNQNNHYNKKLTIPSKLIPDYLNC